MHNTIDKSKIYTMYEVDKDRFTHIGDEKALIAFLTGNVHNGSYDYYYRTKDYFSEFNASGKDTYTNVRIEKVVKEDEFGDEYIVENRIYYEVLKNYIFYDGYGRIVNIRPFKKKVEDESKRREHKRMEGKAKDNFVVGETYVPYRYHHWHRSFKVCYKFRRGAVPGTGHSGAWGGYYRSPKVRSIIRNATIPEYKQYVRKKSIPNGGHCYWDARNIEKSWKSQGKRRHQWERN